jgi:hypothetical protein
MHGQTGVRWILFLVACALVTACGGAHHSRDAHVHRVRGTVTAGRPMRFTLAADTQPVTTTVPTQPIGVVSTSYPGVQLRLYALRRLGPEAALAVYGLYVEPGTGIGVGTQVSIEEAMSVGGLPPGGAQAALSNVSLVDPVGLKQYLTYQTRPGNPNTCVCSLFPSVSTLDSGTTSYFAAVTSAPPASVTSVSFVTGLGTIGNVSLSG